MPSSDPTSRPRLTRDQLRDVLRANVEAFRDEAAFYEYLTDLVIYLMEYEYDWGDVAPGTHRTMVESKFDFVRTILSETAISRNNAGRCRICGTWLNGQSICPNCQTRNRKS